MRVLRILFVVAILVVVFCAGGYLGQVTYEPRVIVEVETKTIYKVVEKEIVKVVYEPVEIETIVVKEIPLKLHDFESFEEMEEWLEETPILIILGKDMSCADFALLLQQRASEDGYLMSFEAIWPNEYNGLFKEMRISVNRIHAINLVIIGNNVYYIEPQTHETAIAGYLD